MKLFKISKFFVFMLSLVVFAIGAYMLIVFMSSHEQRNDERIYIQPSNLQSVPSGYVRVQDMQPNSFGFFTYPSSYNFTDPANAYQRFILIRLPEWMGGDKNDVSSYRAYSALDLDSHCMLRYWPQDGRQYIQDVCHFEIYRIIDGASYFPAVTFGSKPVDNALPKLDLGEDSDGYIYVKTPTWTADKNGLIGDGRHITQDKILETSKMLLDKYENTSKISFPLYLDNQTFLIDMSKSKEQDRLDYTTETGIMKNKEIDVVFCNCTGTADDVDPYENMKNLEVWKTENVTIYAYPYGGDLHNTNYYTFQFFKQGYHVTVYSGTEFSDGIQMALHNFFNSTKLSDLEQAPLDYKYR